MKKERLTRLIFLSFFSWRFERIDIFFFTSQIDRFLEKVFLRDFGFRREIYGKIYRFQDSEIYSEGRNKIVVDTPGIYTVFNIA